MHHHLAHRHTDSHEPSSFGRAFAIGIALNGVYTLVEIYFGFSSHSLSLLSDAGHNFGDVFSMLVAWGAIFLGSRQPNLHRTYGWRRASILAAFANSLLLVAITGGLAWEAIIRFQHPQPVEGGIVGIVAFIGVLVNAFVAYLLISGTNDLNIKGAFLHAASDAGVSLGVVLAGIAIVLTGQNWLDPVSSLLIGVLVLVSTWDLLRESINLMLDAVPRHINLPHIRRYLTSLPGIRGVHQLHVWNISTSETALTAHVVLNQDVDDPDKLLNFVCHDLREHYHVHHITLQFEHPQTGRRCVVESSQ